MVPLPFWVIAAFAALGAALVAGLAALYAYTAWIMALERWSVWRVTRPYWREGMRYALARKSGRSPEQAAHDAAAFPDNDAPSA